MNIKIVLLSVVATLAIIFGGIFLASAAPSTPHVSVSQKAQAQIVGPANFDWGNIAYAGPKATKSFTIKNTGTGMLELYNIKTSCHCTKAYVTIDGQDSPEFGMDMGGSVSSYVGKVAPGKNAVLTVVFDPAFHGPSGIGPITRYAEVATNDSHASQLTFTLTGTVVNN